ncbi:preprotein translocase subunit SecA [Hellea sp.]|nr:preprotein translocase subunit SecA [Hellea sp.]MDA8888813.1 preprotein translocase subunit SecA [Hellea sp.]MDB4844698.1 preprotein translocase subunit SecA [Hellea sp.]MDC0422125.1 preprotein translocase subunit SecA [Hellea sp.]MDC1089060.1 preprotein translocase subunit SecA [Hellea sp.]
MLGIARKIFGTENDRKLKKLRPIVDMINDLEKEYEALSNSALKSKTTEFKKRVQNGEKLDDLLPEAFATVREAAKRTLGQRHYDVQLIGGITLHTGEIAEMRTGEGKTLVSTLAAYLNALSGNGVHIVTVNDYLASRDAEWMGQIYNFLGMTVGCINNHEAYGNERKEAYDCDITYGTNNEFGFDYLRDNMKYTLDEMSQRGHTYAIIDEIDSILIDEARTPLIISGPTDDKSEYYRTINEFIPLITDDGYELDEKARTATFNESGNEQIENILRNQNLLEGDSLYDIENVTIVHHINQALKAHKLFIKDKDYIIKKNEVVLIDEFTGRMMDGRRLSEGLHQAIEAKEKVDIKPENVTLASVTLQNYFRLYNKLSGMTGTAETEASEFAETYGLEVLIIPTNRPIQRIDNDDVIYRTEKEKFNAIVKEISAASKNNQPMLVGTVSIEKSESLSKFLKEKGIKHRVLNARFHEEEASIVAQAGVPGAITIATNMAGRGTDIQLGGNLDMRLEHEIPKDLSDTKRKKLEEKISNEVENLKKQAIEAGGLYVLGTERHESRRIDNQLRGRTGRQGDPGRSKFYLSTEDDLMRIFGGDRLKAMMGKMGWEEGEELTNRFMSKAVERAQIRVETRNFDIRKNLLKYDDVMNDQRKTIFEQRMEFMTDDDVSDVIEDFRHQCCEDLIETYVPKKAYAEQWDISSLTEKTKENLAMDIPFSEWAKEEGIADEEMLIRLKQSTDEAFEQLTGGIESKEMQRIEKQLLLQVIDQNWREHLQQLDNLKSVIGMRAYGQRDPLNEYKSEAFTLFDRLLTDLREGVTKAVTRLLINVQMQRQQERIEKVQKIKDSARSPMDMMSITKDNDPQLSEKDFEGISRNSPCPCGSGKKFKKCCGKTN